MIGKVALVSVSLILVVGVVIAVVAINHVGNELEKEANKPEVKAVTEICAPTDYKDACYESLSPLAKNGTTDPKELLRGVIESVKDEIKKAIDHSVELSNDAKMINNNATLKQALSNCKWYLDYAVNDLEESIAMIVDNKIDSAEDLQPELKNWLSAVLSLKESCIDNLGNPELEKAMSEGLVNATQHTTNALAIVDEIAQILKAFNIPVGSIDLNSTTSNSRKLLSSKNKEATDDGYPSWFRASDRKLLAAGGVTPNAVVAKDGTGQFKTIAEALAAYPKTNGKPGYVSRYVIYVKAGIYDEYITVTETQPNVYMYGDGPDKTIITGSKSKTSGYLTDMTASFSANGRDFVAKEMGFRNTAGPEGEQAVALRVNGDRSAFFNCKIEAYQDTLYVQTHRQFFKDCTISGTVDFIFGDAKTLIQSSKLILRKPIIGQPNAITAHGRAIARSDTGLVIQNCDILAAPELLAVRNQVSSYMGRPWKPFSRTIIMESNIGDIIAPQGWLPWKGDFGLNTLYYVEYNNRGPGSNTANRVKWAGLHVIKDRATVLRFTANTFLHAQRWLQRAGVPFQAGLMS